MSATRFLGELAEIRDEFVRNNIRSKLTFDTKLQLKFAAENQKLQGKF